VFNVSAFDVDKASGDVNGFFGDGADTALFKFDAPVKASE
jgi:hypothetical protein